MKKINYMCMLALMIFLSSPLVSANKNLEDFYTIDKTDDLFSELSEIDALSFQNQWVLIILNRNLQESNMLVDYLADNDTNTESLMLMILGNETSKKSFEKNQNLESFNWLNLSNAKILDFLEIKATPLIIGMNNSTVEWKIVGFNEESDFLHNLIEKWSLK